jgi:hypothetical protein
MSTQQVTMDVPLALQHLIKTNNEVLRAHQSQLLREIEEANTQLMQILQLDPAAGWRLDMNNMVYVRVIDEETES